MYQILQLPTWPVSMSPLFLGEAENEHHNDCLQLSVLVEQ